MDIQELMQKAREFQGNLNQVKEELGRESVEGSAGGGMVTAVFNGRGELIDLIIAPELLKDPAMLRDLLCAAVNSGIAKAKDLGRGKMARLTGGLDLSSFM